MEQEHSLPYNLANFQDVYSSNFHQLDHSLEEIESAIVALFQKLNGFSVSIQNLGDLADGVALSELLERIPSGFFNSNQLEREIEDNWALSHRNLTKLIDSIERYYQQILKASEFDKESILDIMEISRHGNKGEIVKLVELVLGVMVQSEQKSEFIQVITQLDKNHQTILMFLIEKWIVRENCNIQEDQDANENMTSSRISITAINNGTHTYYMQQYQLVLKKLDELEKENYHLIEREQIVKHELEEKERKLVGIENQLAAKDDEVKKLKLQKEGLLMSLGMGPNEDLETVVKEKEIQITKLNLLVSSIQKQSGDDHGKLKEELEQLERKYKILQKQNEQIDFFKIKYSEMSALTEKINETEKSNKSLEKSLQDKDSQIEMLKEKLQEFKQIFSEERKKVVEKDIQLSQHQSMIEEIKKQKEQLEHSLQVQEDKYLDISSTLEKVYSNLEEKNNHSILSSSKKQQNINVPKGLNQDLSQIIDDLERENVLLKSEQTSCFLDSSALNLEDVNHLKEQVSLFRKTLEATIKEKLQLQSKVDSLSELNVEKLKTDNERLRGDYQALLIKGLKAKEQEKENEREAILTESDQKLKIYSRAKENLEKRVTELQTKVNQQQVIIEDKQQLLQAQNQGYKNLFQQKNEELEILYGVIYEIRQRYHQIATREKSAYSA